MMVNFSCLSAGLRESQVAGKISPLGLSVVFPEEHLNR